MRKNGKRSLRICQVCRLRTKILTFYADKNYVKQAPYAEINASCDADPKHCMGISFKQSRWSAQLYSMRRYHSRDALMSEDSILP
jgi:hypothetical protein